MRRIESLALIANSARSMINFRGPLIAALTAAGVRVHALAPDFDAESRAAVRALGAEPVDISLDRAGVKPVRDLVDTIRLAGILRRLAPDAVLSYFLKPVVYGSLAARLAGVPRRFALVAGLGHAFREDSGPVMRLAALILLGLGFSACERVFFQNGEDIDELVGAGIIARAKVCRVNGTGVDLARLRPAPPVTAPLRFLMMARLLREKGFEAFAAAARIVRAAHPEAEFVILGGADPNPGALPAETVAAWAEEGLVRWPGHVADVTAEVAACSVCVLPSYYREGVPRSSQEAMAMAKPLITTDHIGCRETVIDGVNGFLVPVRDVPALAAAMIRFIEQPALIGPMGLESRALAERRFDVVEINAAMLAAMGIGPDA